MSITNNISAINTQRNLTINNRGLSKSLEKLSSGYRINTGQDGPADLVISEQLRAQNAGLQRAVKNTSEAMNVLGIAEGALNEMNEILKKMRALALHAANSGITSPIQVAADQSEVDSAIQTIDRIANTTKYSDQFLLNGNKSLTSTRTVVADKSTDTSLLDTGLTRIDQIFKRDGYSINLSFAGATDSNETTAVETKMAKRAYFEAESGVTGTDIDATGKTLSQDQRFTITGVKGSRTFSFGNGTHLGEVAATINNLADSTGVGAQLIFDSTVSGTTQAADKVANGTGAGIALRGTGEQTAYQLDSNGNLYGSAAVMLTTTAVTGAVSGKNTDGDGRLYLKWTSATDYTAYKDKAMEVEVGRGTDGGAFTATNSSGLGALVVTTTTGVATAGDITIIDTGAGGGALEFNDTGVDTTGMADLAAVSILTNDAGNVISGVRLGENTDANGNLYFKFSGAAGAKTIEVFKDANMTQDSLVAKATGVDLDDSGGSDNTVFQLVEQNNSGLFMTLNHDGTAVGAGAGDDSVGAGDITGTLAFDNLGVRLYSSEYGEEEYVKVQAHEGALWADSSGTLLDAGITGAEANEYGQNATVTINGLELELDGIESLLSTQDINAKFVFNEGELGKTTIAVAGYNDGAVASRAGQLANGVNSQATKAMHNTSEILDQFEGGMQFQLGEGAGDQERTVYSIQSMAVANLGKVKFTDDFDGTGAIETKMLSMQDMLGGGYASLALDPVKALEIIDQAIQDVSNLRARIGATQSNMLQTNANSLSVAIENIAKTESSIRDADMAVETTEFTKNQVLINASTSMLAQANAQSQNVLKLLG
jgi:flagellin